MATIFFASASYALLFAGFRWNLWRVADPYFFALNQKDAEALVIGRMVVSRQRGLFASAGLLGFAGAGPGVVTFDPTELWQPERFDFQTRAYLEGTPIRSFSPYFSHSGLQGMGFSAADALFSRTPPAFRLALFHTLASLFVTAAYTLVVLWLRREFGTGAALLALLVMAGSPWLTAFARNLYWSLWLFLLPVLGIGAVLSRSPEGVRRGRALATVGFATLLIRFLCGYEFATATAAMAAAPVLYSSIRDRWPMAVLARRLGLLAGIGLLAFLASLAILALQITVTTGSARNAMDHIRLAIGRRTSGEPSRFPPIYAVGLSAKTSDVLRSYFEDRFDRGKHSRWPTPLQWLVSRSYGELIIWVVIAGIWAAARTHWRVGEGRFRPLGLIAMTACILSGIMGWLVIFKAHSFAHLHVNPLMWNLLFLPLGGILIVIALVDAASLAGRAIADAWSSRGATGF